MISDIQDWSSGNLDWEQARSKIEDKYGYSKFPGNCHIVPNHALIILSLLFGDDDFQKSLMIVNTAGWDTDCNSGNVGCILGIKNGLEGIKQGPDYITPVNDIIYLPTAYGSETMTDALLESQNIINITRKMNGLESKVIKNNARYNFEMETSTQGWMVDKSNDNNLNTSLSNVDYKSDNGTRALQVSFNDLSFGLASEIFVDSFFPEWFTKLEGYQVQRYFHYDYVACPIVYSGQKIKTEIISQSEKDLRINLFIKYWGEEDKLIKLSSDDFNLRSKENNTIEWVVPDTFANPIGQIGISINSDDNVSGKILINYLNISGTPKMTFRRPDHIDEYKRGIFYKEEVYGQLWKRAWVNDVDKWQYRHNESFKVVRGIGRGHIMTGSETWKDYSISSKISIPLASAAGLIVRSQGLKRYYSLELTSENKLKINKMEYELKTLNEIDFNLEYFKDYDLKFKVDGNKLQGYVDNQLLIEAEDSSNPFEEGMMGFLTENGAIQSNSISIE